ncbi:hypothetical protein N9Q68_01435 [Polaribacter sp.]|nr:hypothetical protein [Polaribacter sp.]
MTDYEDWIFIHEELEENQIAEYFAKQIEDFYRKILNSKSTENKKTIMNFCNMITETIFKSDINADIEELKKITGVKIQQFLLEEFESIPNIYKTVV